MKVVIFILCVLMFIIPPVIVLLIWIAENSLSPMKKIKKKEMYKYYDLKYYEKNYKDYRRGKK